MSDETTAVLPGDPAPAATDETLIETGQPGTPDGEPSPGDTAQQSQDWRDKRIAKLTAQKYERERRLAELEAALAAKAEAPEGQTPATPDINAEVERRFQQERFNEACNAVARKGSEKFQDFSAALQNMAQLGEAAVSRTFLEALIELPNAEEVYYHMGKDLNKASAILDNSPTRMALKLAELSQELRSKTTPVSKAPTPPSDSVAGKGTADTGKRTGRDSYAEYKARKLGR